MDENEDTFTVPWMPDGDLEINVLRGIDHLLAHGVSVGLDATALDRMRNWLSSKMDELVTKAGSS